MSYALVDHVTVNSVNPSSAINTTGASLLVCIVSALGADASFDPSDSKGNTWHQAGGFSTGNGSGSIALFYAFNLTVGSGHTFSIPSGSFPSACFSAWSGATVTDPFDQLSQNIGGPVSAPAQPGSITPTQANELIILGSGNLQSSTPTYNNGFTGLDFVALIGGVNYSSAVAYLIQTSAVPSNPTISVNVDSIIQASFFAATVTVTGHNRLPLLGVS